VTADNQRAAAKYIVDKIWDPVFISDDNDVGGEMFCFCHQGILIKRQHLYKNIVLSKIN